MPVPFVTDTVIWSDSLTLGGCRATAKIAGRYPAGENSRLSDSVRAWLGERLSYVNIYSETPVFTPTDGEIADGRKLVEAAGVKLMEETAGHDFGEFVKDSISVTYEFDLGFRPVFESDSLLTYTFSGYGYMGGAHGGAVGLAQTFDRNSGLSLTYGNSFMPSKRQELIELIREGLWKQYFKANFEDSADGTDPTLRNALLIDPDTLPLPACPPDFRSDGVVFLYQQYEIACYAAGMPACKIPYDILEPLMTPEVRRLVP